jgi:glycosyltransferase involved in cell wall biosynthesis
MTRPPFPVIARAATRVNGLVSVVIPCYRQAQFLAEAIESALAQTYRDTEVVVVNDGSPDDTAAVAARYHVRYVEQKNGGLSEARNAGLALSRGEFVVFLDADDRLTPDAVRVNVALLSADPALGFVAGYSRYISREGQPMQTDPPRWAGADRYVELLRRNRIRHPAMVMFRRSVFDRVGGFDPSVDACADYDMYLRVSREYRVLFHDALVAEYRRHGENMSLDAALMLRQLSRTMRKQRRYVALHPSLKAARRDGLRNMKEYYGDQFVDSIRARVRTRRNLLRAVADTGWLLVLYPKGLLVHAFRKLLKPLRHTPPPAGPDPEVALTEGGTNLQRR